MPAFTWIGAALENIKENKFGRKEFSELNVGGMVC
jgi:hypothetical protein